MSATATLNGKPQRKQLADQLDRLDGIIDALAEGLNGAVADACREGTRLAVKDAIVEILTNPELRALLVPQVAHMPVAAPSPATPPEPKKPGIWSRLKTKVAAARTAVAGFATQIKTTIAAKVAAVTTAVTAASTVAGEALPVRQVLGVGLLVGLVCYQLPESAAVAGVGAAGTTVAVQIGTWLKRAVRWLGLMS